MPNIKVAVSDRSSPAPSGPWRSLPRGVLVALPVENIKP
jgi:hypothetical protein